MKKVGFLPDLHHRSLSHLGKWGLGYVFVVSNPYASILFFY